MEELDIPEIDWRRLDDELALIHWRIERLLALGYASVDAAFLAVAQVDINELERLIAKGCPHDTAARIAA